jgi:hypothetical protein
MTSWKFTEKYASSNVSKPPQSQTPHSQNVLQVIMQSKSDSQILSAKCKRIPEDNTAQIASAALTSAQPKAKVRKSLYTVKYTFGNLFTWAKINGRKTWEENSFQSAHWIYRCINARIDIIPFNQGNC